MNIDKLYSNQKPKPLINYCGKDLYLVTGKYIYDGLYIGLIDKKEEIWCDVTINLAGYILDDNEFFLNGDITNELKEKLFSTKVFQRTKSKVKYNLGTYERVKFKKNLIEDYKYKKFYIRYIKAEKSENHYVSYYYKKYDTFGEALESSRKLFEKNNWDCLEIVDVIDNVIFFKDKNIKDFHIGNKVISRISKNLYDEYSLCLNNGKELPIDSDLVYTFFDNKYIAIDKNFNNDTKNFHSEIAAQKWLLKEKEKIGDFELNSECQK